MPLPSIIYSSLMKLYFTNNFVSKIKDYIKPVTGMVLLDAPCGTASLHSICMPSIYHGIDLDSDRVAAAISKRLVGNFSVQDASALCFQDSMFDVILASGLFHHVDDDLLNRILHEFSRVLKPGGRVVVLDAIWPTSKYNVIGYLARYLDEGKHVRHVTEYIDHFNRVFVVDQPVTFTKLGSDFLLVKLLKSS